LGYEVITAKHAKDALELFAKHQQNIRLALLDVVMPEMEGVQLAQYLREVQPELPVLFMSGYDRDQLDKDKSIVNSMMLTKPVNIPELSGAIQRLL